MPAEVDDVAPAAPREVVEAGDHLAHPVRLAGDVAVVRAVLGAGRDEAGAVQQEWPGGGYDHLGLNNQSLQGRVVGGVGDEQRQVLQIWAELLTNLLQGVSTATSDAPL